MKNVKQSVKKTKDDTVSDANKKKRTAPTSVTKTSRATGPRNTGKTVSKTAAKSESNTQKISGVSRTGASKVKNNPQSAEKKFTTSKTKTLR